MTAITPPPVQLLDDEARDELAVRHLDLVARVVCRLPIAIPQGLDRDDLIGAGTVGLLTAARTYQPMRGASFRTYAYLAIRGAVLDELRRHDPLPRGARARLKELRTFENDFRANQGRLPTPGEIGDRFALAPEDVEELLAQSEAEQLLRAPTQNATGEEFDAVDAGAPAPDREASNHEELEQVEAAIRDLPERERQVVVLYFAENLFLKDIGALLGVTESRVCQILACAQQKIRARLDALRQKNRRPESA